jgi:hypothetical protein
MTSANVARATKFIVSRILEQAKQDEVELTDLEIRMLAFAEASASAEDLKCAKEFDSEVDDDQYENKIAGLIRKAYRHDKECGEDAVWDGALADLEEEDNYLQVMIVKAGIGRSSPFSLLTDWRFIVAALPTVFFVAAGIVIAFTPYGAKLIRNDLLRLALFLILLGAPFLISRIGNGKVS